MNTKSLCVITSEALPKHNKFWKKIIKNTIYKTGIGIIIKINENKFVLTCSHCVEYAKTINIYFDKKKYNATCVINARDLDIAILRIELDSNVQFIELNKQEIPISNVGDPTKIYSKMITKKKKIKNKIYNGILNKKYYDKQYSVNLPPTPFYDTTIDIEIKNINKLKSMSGSPVVNESNDLIGLVSSILHNSSAITIVPIVCIMRVINEFTCNNIYSGLCNIPIMSNVIMISEEEPAYGLYIINSYGINYNCFEKKRSRRYKNIKNGDIIVAINDLVINEDGNVNCNKLNMKIPINTYIAIHYHKSTPIKISIYRKNKDDDEHKFIEINMLTRSNNTMVYIPKITSEYFEYNGMIFVELSEDIIENYYLNNKKLTGTCVQKYNINPYRNEHDKKIVALVDTLPQFQKNALSHIIYKYTLIPVNEKENKYSIPIVTKINSNIIKNLDMFTKIVKQNYKSKIHFKISDGLKHSVAFTNE